jgi:DNA-binding MarR family transcriptional regulator
MDRCANLLGALVVAVGDKLREVECDGQAAVPDAAVVHLSHCAKPSIDSLSHALTLSHSATVRLADRMVEARLVVRAVASWDRRAVALRLTSRGTARVEQILVARGHLLTELLDGATTVQERRIFARIAERMLTALTPSAEPLYRTCRLCDFEACSKCPVEAAAK